MGATFGTLVLSNGSRTYNIDASIPDAVATNITWNMTGLSGTGTASTFRAPCNGVITDLILGTAPTAVGCTILVNSIPQQGGCVRYITQMINVLRRAPLAIPVKQGDIISAVQW